MLTRPCGSARAAIFTRDLPLAVKIERSLAVTMTECVVVRDPPVSWAGAIATLYDLVIVDYLTVDNLGRRLRLLRCRWPTCGILVINVPTELQCMQYLDDGADDACTATSPALPSRLHALARRARTLNAESRVAFGDVVIDREHRRVWCASVEVFLSRREYDLLLRLFNIAPGVVRKDVLAEAICHDTQASQKNTIEVYVGYLRRKLQQSHTVGITTVRNIGYALQSRGLPPKRVLDEGLALSVD
jgi:DNA-binding response OmpR family regulator